MHPPSTPWYRAGSEEEDFFLGLELLNNPKDHVEFCLVRDWISAQLRPQCSALQTEVQKSVIKQHSMQVPPPPPCLPPCLSSTTSRCLPLPSQSSSSPSPPLPPQSVP